MDNDPETGLAMLAMPERKKRMTPVVMVTLMPIAWAMEPRFGIRSINGMQHPTASTREPTEPNFFSSRSAKK